MVDVIDWSKAPEDATHAFVTQEGEFRGAWRKVQDGEVYDWHKGKQKFAEVAFDTEVVWLKKWAKQIVKRPEPLPELPAGYKWEDALEGTTHFLRDVRYGHQYWLKVVGGEYYWSTKADEFSENPGLWKEETFDDKTHWLLIPKGDAVIVAKVQEPKPVPKQPVGWWS